MGTGAAGGIRGGSGKSRKNADLYFGSLSFVWRLSEQAGFGGRETGMGLPKLCRGEPKGPTEHY